MYPPALAASAWGNRDMPRIDREIAYFSLEIGLEADIPTYSGGLGVLAGDTLRAAADIELPYVGVTLLYKGGYFKQQVGAGYGQKEAPDPWDPATHLRPMAPRVVVPIDGRDVRVRAWRLDLKGTTGYTVPVYYLDTDLDHNDPDARALTERLYEGGTDHRIRQEAVLGIGGRRMLRAIGHELGTFHMNEGHASFVCIELLSEQIAQMHERRRGYETVDELGMESLSSVRSRCVFTTHTPVEAGHDRFHVDDVRKIIGDHPVLHRPDLYGHDKELNTTRLAMNFSGFVNAVARKHAEVSREMFPGYPIQAITNGIHAASWAAPAMRDLFDTHCPLWRASNADLRMVAGVSDDDLLGAHAKCKYAMLDMVQKRTGRLLSPDVLTLVFSRRMTDYKRPSLMLDQWDRIRELSEKTPVQFIFAGKAHPHDMRGKEIIESILSASDALKGQVEIAFIEAYEIEISKLLVSGADIWLNNPRPPLEASGTSGMKAAVNGVPSLSTMDGWWHEGWVEGVTGWAIGESDDDLTYAEDNEAMDTTHRDSALAKLGDVIAPLYYQDKPGWASVMRHCITLNGSHFTTERMVREYALRAYLA